MPLKVFSPTNHHFFSHSPFTRNFCLALFPIQTSTDSSFHPSSSPLLLHSLFLPITFLISYPFHSILTIAIIIIKYYTFISLSNFLLPLALSSQGRLSFPTLPSSHTPGLLYSTCKVLLWTIGYGTWYGTWKAGEDTLGRLWHWEPPESDLQSTDGSQSTVCKTLL